VTEGKRSSKIAAALNVSIKTAEDASRDACFSKQEEYRSRNRLFATSGLVSSPNAGNGRADGVAPGAH